MLRVLSPSSMGRYALVLDNVQPAIRLLRYKSIAIRYMFVI